MTNLFPRVLLAISAILLLFGGVMHTIAFQSALAATASSDLPPFFTQAFKALWLTDSVVVFALAAVFGWIAVRPSVAAGSVVVLLALVPVGAAVLLYCFVGLFVAAHVSLLAGIFAITAGLRSITA